MRKVVSSSHVELSFDDFITEPHVQWNHEDGPLLTWAGHLHILSWRERLELWLGVSSPRYLALKKFGRPIFPELHLSQNEGKQENDSY